MQSINNCQSNLHERYSTEIKYSIPCLENRISQKIDTESCNNLMHLSTIKLSTICNENDRVEEKEGEEADIDLINTGKSAQVRRQIKSKCSSSMINNQQTIKNRNSFVSNNSPIQTDQSLSKHYNNNNNSPNENSGDENDENRNQTKQKRNAHKNLSNVKQNMDFQKSQPIISITYFDGSNHQNSSELLNDMHEFKQNEELRNLSNFETNSIQLPVKWRRARLTSKTFGQKNLPHIINVRKLQATKSNNFNSNNHTYNCGDHDHVQLLKSYNVTTDVNLSNLNLKHKKSRQRLPLSEEIFTDFQTNLSNYSSPKIIEMNTTTTTTVTTATNSSTTLIPENPPTVVNIYHPTRNSSNFEQISDYCVTKIEPKNELKCSLHYMNAKLKEEQTYRNQLANICVDLIEENHQLRMLNGIQNVNNSKYLPKSEIITSVPLSDPISMPNRNNQLQNQSTSNTTCVINYNSRKLSGLFNNETAI